MSTDAIARLYDRWSHFYDLADEIGPLGGQEKKWRALAAEKIRNVQGWVLDAGCGTGIMMLALESVGFMGRLVSVDTSRRMAERTRKRASGLELDVSVLLADACRLPLKHGCLDGVICTFSITTIARPERAASEFERTLCPGSKLVVMDSEKPHNLVARLFYPALVPISRVFCKTHIDRDVCGLLDQRSGLAQEGRETYLGGMVAVYEYRRVPAPTGICKNNGGKSQGIQK